MHSLKELRAENEARRRSRDLQDSSQDRTVGGDPAAASAPLGGVVTAGVPRPGRTLAPLASAGPHQSAESGASVRVGGGEGASHEKRSQDRELRKSRRRRRRERERDAGSEDADEGADVLSADSSFVGGGIASAVSTQGSKSQLQNAARQADADDVEGDASDSSRRRGVLGNPPQERPKKTFSPLAARRARIVQQKREEAKRLAEAPRGSPRADATSMASDRPDKEAEPSVPSHLDAESDMTTSAARITSGNGHRSQRPKEQRDGGMEGAQDSRADAKTDPPSSSQGLQGKVPEFATGEGERLKTDAQTKRQDKGADELDDRFDGRLQMMRSRMKQAGKEFMSKKSPQGFRSGDYRDEGGTMSTRVRGNGARADEGESGDSVKDKSGLKHVAAGSEEEDGHGPDAISPRSDGSDSTSKGSTLVSPALSDDDDGVESDVGPRLPMRSIQTRRSKGSKKAGGRSNPHSDGMGGVGVDGDKGVTLGHVVDRKMREMGYIRKPAIDNLKNRRSLRERVAAERAPEVHFIGELSGANGFGSGISCRFRIEGGRHWSCLAGLEDGQTHVIHVDFGDAFTPWNHPIDIHYTTKSIQVWQLDSYGRNVLRGYGFRHLPTASGFSKMSVPCWRPAGTMQEETAAFFLGVTPRLAAEDAVFNRAWDQRCRLVTLPAGTVLAEMNVLFRNLQDQDIDSLLEGKA